MLMLKEFITQFGKSSAAVLLALVLAGCGSGGGTDNILCGGDPCFPDDGAVDTSGPTSDGEISVGSGTGSAFQPGVLTTEVGVFSLSPSGSTTVTVNVVDATNELITTEVTINFDSTCVNQGLSVFDQRVVVTSAGTATVTYTSQGCVGADTLTASVGELTASAIINIDPEVISIGSGAGDAFTPGVLDLGIGIGTTLSAGGQTTVLITVANQEGILQTADITNSTEVTVTSGCVAAGLATLDNNTVFTVTGSALVTYTDNGCGVAPNGFVDSIVATALGVTGQVEILIAPDTVNQVQFVSVDPAELFLAGTGGQETSLVTFRVRGQLGGPVVGADVDFSLTTEIGGLSLSSLEGVTNNLGEVSVTVQAGTVPTPVRVNATERSSGISTISDGLTVATGIADFDNFSVVADVINPECWTGRQAAEKATITAFVGDVFNNPPPDGTVVNFTTEGGVVESFCTTENGACSVFFNCTPDFVADGRIEVLGYTVGAESFDDLNGNGVFDLGDDFVPADNDKSEAFRDDNENGVFDDIISLDFGGAGGHDGPDGLYTGPACDGTNVATACSGNSTLHVFNSVTMVQSDPSVTRIFSGTAVPASAVVDFDTFYGVAVFDTLTGTTLTVPTGTGVNFGYFIVGDSNNNSLPNGTTIAITSTNGDVAAVNVTVLNTTRPAIFQISIGADDTPSTDGNLEIRVTVPDYGEVLYSWPIDDT